MIAGLDGLRFSHWQAEQRADGIVRVSTSALVDGQLLIDGNADSPAAAARAGTDLTDVRHLLVTHAHVDHLAPQLLLFRSWVRQDPVDVIGPADVLEACRPWVAPDAPMRWIEAVPGATLSVGDYLIRPLAAQHQVISPGDAVLYDVTGPAGERLLWACDTGPLPLDWFAAVEGAGFDVVLAEQTFGHEDHGPDRHLNLTSFGSFVEQLRSVGAVAAATEVVAVHLSHHNPPEAELTAELARLGARPGHDGEVIEPRL